MLSPPRLLLIGIVLAVAVAGCRNRPSGDDDVDQPAAELTAAQKAAIDDVFAQVEATAMALTATLEGIDEVELDFLQSESSCPDLELNRDPQTGTTVIVDFAEGCTSDLYGESAVSGSVTITLSLVTASFELVFTNFTVEEQTSNGGLSATYSRDGGTRTLVGQLDLTTTGAGTVSGSLTLITDGAAVTITMSEASLSLEPDGGEARSVTMENLRIAPIVYGNFLPESGTITFEVPGEGAGGETLTIHLSFDDQSPVDRTIDVTVGSSPPVEYTLPGP